MKNSTPNRIVLLVLALLILCSLTGCVREPPPAEALTNLPTQPPTEPSVPETTHEPNIPEGILLYSQEQLLLGKGAILDRLLADDVANQSFLGHFQSFPTAQVRVLDEDRLLFGKQETEGESVCCEILPEDLPYGEQRTQWILPDPFFKRRPCR